MGSLPKQIKKIVQIEIALVLIALIILNPFGGALAMSINSQEFFSYHLRDLIQGLSGEQQQEGEYALATGVYETQIDGELFGIGKGRNLIVVQLESIQNIMLQRDYDGQEIMPNLNALIDQPGTVYFNNYYSQTGAGNTSDAEFVSNNGILGSMESYTYQLFQDNYFYGLPQILKHTGGYHSYVLHGFKKEFWNRESMYPVLGFDRFYSADDFANDYVEGIGGGNITGISDGAFYDQATDYMMQLPQPYYSFLISLSSHNPFKLPDHLREISINPEHNNILGDYINSVHYADRCVGEFLQHLKEKGLYDNSVIVFYGDHFGLTKADTRIDEVVSDWIGEPYRYDMMMNVPLIIHIPGEDINKTLENSGGQMDLMPTLCYLLGVETLDTIYLGQNLFSGQNSVAAFQMYMLKGSYVKGNTVFEMSRDGIFENSKAWDRRTGLELTIDGCRADWKRANQIVDFSAFYLRNDVLRLSLVEGKTIDEILAQIAGAGNPLPAQLEMRFVKAGDQAAMGALIRRFSENNGERILLMSDDILALLTELDEEYSGKSKQRGHASMDSAANQAFLQVQRGLVPVLDSAEEYIKVGYLGYRDMVFAPGFANYPDQGFLESMEANRPGGIAIPEEIWAHSRNVWSGHELPVYIYDLQILTKSGMTQAYRPSLK